MIIKRGTLVKIKDKDYVYDNYPEFYNKTQTCSLNKYTYLTGSNPQSIDDTFKVLERKKDYDSEEICVIVDIQRDTGQVYLVGISGLEREDKIPVKMTNEEQEEITTLNSDVFIEEITDKVNKNLSKSLEMINNTLSKKSEFESKMIDGIVAKGKEIAVEDLKDELKKDLEVISQKVLTDSLRSMEEDGIITRTVYAEVPPRVEYALSELGESMRPIIKSMEEWGISYKNMQ